MKRWSTTTCVMLLILGVAGACGGGSGSGGGGGGGGGGTQPSNPPPAVTSITPALGPAAGGTSVTITGSNFLAGAVVAIGGTNATNVTVVSSTSITATTAARGAGRAEVSVRNTDGNTGALPDAFAYWMVTAAITGGPYLTNHDTPVTINGSSSTSVPFAIARFLWDCGQTVPAVPTNCTSQTSSPTPQFRYRRLTSGGTVATYTVTLTVEDSQGNRSAPTTTTVRVTNSY